MDGAIGAGAIGSPLDAALAQVLAEAGGQVVRLVDGRSARVLGAAGWGRREDLTALVRLAGHALPVAAADGGLTDLVLTAGRTVHVLRPGPAATVLVLRLGTGEDLDMARRVLAAPRTFGALSAAMPLRPVQMPAQRGPAHELRAVPVQRGPRGALRPGQPALTALAAPLRAPGSGALAALALGAPAPAVPLPRRPQPEPVPAQRRASPGEWAADDTTLRRLLDGLRRL